MCIGPHLDGVQSFAPLAMPNQPIQQVMFLQAVPAGHVPMLMTAIPVTCQAQLLLPLQKPLSPVTSSDDQSSEGTPMPPATDTLSRAQRRRLRQRDNKKRDKAALAWTQAAVDVDRCTTDEELYSHEEIVDRVLHQKSTSAVKTTQIPQILIVEVDVDRVQDVPIFPKLFMKFVPVCAYQAVQRLDEMPEILVEDAMVIKSSGKGELPKCASTAAALKQSKVSALPCAKVESIPVMNTFIHVEMDSARSSGSRHRSHYSAR